MNNISIYKGVDHAVSNEDRMFLYLWYELGNDKECKFGERFVRANLNPVHDCLKRIRESLGVRKDRFDEGTIIVVSTWDSSSWAKQVGRNRVGGHMDDFLREKIGFRKGSSGEVHSLPADEMAVRVNQLFQKNNQPLIRAALSPWQYAQAEEILNAIELGKRTILAELCARFGKTIWAGALAVETDSAITIIASYVLTSFASFTKDITSFEQFRHFVIVDAASFNYQELINKALNDNKQVIVFLSMVGSQKRQDRIDFLFDLEHLRLLFIDEADFGAHTKRQADPFIKARKEDDVIILMTGTNGERAVGNWVIDHYLSTTYIELLMEKSRYISKNY